MVECDGHSETCGLKKWSEERAPSPLPIPPRTIVQCVDSSVESKEKAEEYERKAKAELQALREQVRAEKQVAR